MNVFTTLARIVAIATGGIILLTISNSTIETVGAVGPDADAIYALSAGVFVTAGIIGLAWSANRKLLAGFLGLCLLAGEGYNFLKTAEREVTKREAAQNAVSAALVSRETLRSNVQKAEAALTAAQAAVTAKSAEKTCVKNCAQLLTNAASTARADVATARSLFEAAELPASATPLSDRSGFAAWVIDLMAAGLKSLAMNGLAAGLVAFGAHGAAAGATVREAVHQPATSFSPQIIVSDEPAPISPEEAFAATKTAALSTNDNISDADLAAVAALFRADVEPDGTGGGNGGGRVIRPKRWQRDEVRADLERVIASGQSFPSQRAMANKYGVPTTTLHDWFKAWSAEGQEVRRQQVGRRKRVG